MSAQLPDEFQPGDDAGTLVIEGLVEHGDQRGRTLGFPTANVLDVSSVRLDGVYAATAQIDPAADAVQYVAAVSVGHRPTYYSRDGLRLLEAHLLDFQGDLYDRWIRLELHVRLRPQHRFVDTPTLVRQLHLDVKATRAWATTNGWQHLLAPQPEGARGRRHRVTRSRNTDWVAKASVRNARRIAVIADVVNATSAHELTHALVAERTGIPLGYLTWRFPSVGDLRALGEPCI